MSSSPSGSQAIRQPNYWIVGLIVGSWIILSTGLLFVVANFYSPKAFEWTFIYVAVASIFLYICLFARHGWIMILIVMLSGILQCGGCVKFVGYRSTLSGPVRSACCNNLRNIGLAMEGYHKLYGTFPPAYVAGKNGQPLYSWTVPLLPFIEESNLYEDLHLDEPWNSPHNQKLTKMGISVFHCPARKPYWHNQHNHIGYVGVVGPDTAWSGAVGRPLSEFTDGPENTILLFEVAALDIPWAAPPTLTLDQAIDLFTKGDSHGPSSRHDPPNISVLYADGSIGSLPGDIPPETLRALLTVNGGEKVVIPPPVRESSLP
jgi:hypothetical protein